ncbi:MAG: hypothetical protein Q4D85_11105 [Corynebacterium sp.]|uniref:hypothetical protein n=1 Tax=Corynebacterium sp. TaxID=1720 RepID=UPI0026DC384F|nr:hypothetical protein [Corynebacterium sp.]MDO5099282.1 hypothetical protein [Corynebacterium sp.]
MPRLTTLSESIVPYPEPQSVFVGSEEDIAQAAKILLPLLSIDLSAVDPELSGTVHLVCPVEHNGASLLGEGTEKYHSTYACTNWVGFRLTDDNRYEFLGDWRYFHSLNPESPIAHDPDFVGFTKESQKSYQKHKQFYHKHGVLGRRIFGKPFGLKHPRTNPLPFLDVWHEPPCVGNWQYAGSFPTRDITVDTESGTETATFPITDDGRPFRFIGAVPGYSYFDFGPDAILLFFDPETRIALLTFDWT